MGATLPRYRPPKAGESFMGYLWALAVLNGYESLQPIGQMAGLISSGRIQEGMASRGELGISGLAHVAAQSEEALEALVYRQTSPGRLRFGSVDVQVEALRPGRIRACPQCMVEGQPYKQLWEFGWYTACHHHHLELIEACSDCGRKLTWTTNFAKRCRCGSTRPLRAASAAGINVALAREVASLAEGNPADSCRPYADLSGLYFAMEMMVRITDPLSMAAGYEFTPTQKGGQELYVLAADLYPAILNRDRFTSFLRSHVGKRLANFPLLGLPGASIAISRELRRSNGPAHLKSWIKDSLAGAHAWRSSVGDEAHFLEEDPPLSIRDVALVLGISHNTVRQLLTANLISFTRGSKSRGGSDRLTTSSALHEFVKRIDQSAVATHSSEHWIRMPAAAEDRVAFGTLGITELVKGVLDKTIRVRKSTGEGLAAFEVAKEDWARRRLSERVGAGLTVSAICEKLGMYPDAVYRLMTAGLLAFETHPRGRIVTEEALSDFVATYAPISTLAKSLATNPRTLTAKIRSAGVEPVSGPSVDGGLIFVFRTVDLAELDLSEVAARSRYTTRAGRRRSTVRSPVQGLLTTAQVAQKLGLSSQGVASLVRRGHLKEHPMSRRASNTRYFDPSELDAMRARTAVPQERPAVDLIGRGQLAKHLGIKPYVVGNLLKLGKLRPADTERVGLKTRNLYRIADAEVALAG